MRTASSDVTLRCHRLSLFVQPAQRKVSAVEEGNFTALRQAEWATRDAQVAGAPNIIISAKLLRRKSRLPDFAHGVPELAEALDHRSPEQNCAVSDCQTTDLHGGYQTLLQIMHANSVIMPGSFNTYPM